MYDQDEYVGLDEDVLKTTSEDEDQRRLEDVFKANVCWECTMAKARNLFFRTLSLLLLKFSSREEG